MSSAPFVTTLRARRATINLAPDGVPTITVRVEMPEVWDVVRIVVSPNEPALVVKIAALEALFPEAEEAFHGDFALKLRGWEILDEAASLTDVGVIDGSILLLTFRRRRPVR
ncbi:MAG TPA: hypothetical protein VIP11_25665 [Gemmatimonadaceae bacterium]